MIPVHDKTIVRKEGIGIIYLAGGCFWGVEKYLRSIPGVVRTTVGYANGIMGIKPVYKRVSTGLTGYLETVRVEYDPKKVSLEAILFAYFRIIDPEAENRQGNDIGTQYQAGIYFSDRASGSIVLHVTDVERLRYPRFNVETAPLTSFYDAEEEHQGYLDKNPGAYCHISQKKFDLISVMLVDPAKYSRPNDSQIMKMLTEKQYRVTQLGVTEMPFENEYWDKEEKGLYVDIVTGEPLFSSSDKYKCPSGWPTFARSIDENTLVLISGITQGQKWTELRSRAGNSYLGSLFYDDSESPTGIRYCINGAALRFIPYAEMEKEGYGYLMERVK